MTRILTAACLCLLLATGAVALAAQGKSAAAAAGAADGASVDSIVSALYASVSHGPDAEPDWDRLRAITLPVGMFIPPKKPTEDIFTVLDVDAFQERVRKGAAATKAKGESTAFSEREASRHTDCFGNVCQIFSTYEGAAGPTRSPSGDQQHPARLRRQAVVDRLGRLGHGAA